MRAVAEHGEENIGAAPGEGNVRLIVAFTLGTFAVVTRPGRRMMQSGEGREEQCPLESLVAPSARMLTPDGGPRAASNRGNSGVRG